MTYSVVVVREEDGRHSVAVPALPGCHTWGQTLPEALRMAEDAMRLYLEVLIEDGKTPPADVDPVPVELGEANEASVYRVELKEAAPVA